MPTMKDGFGWTWAQVYLSAIQQVRPDLMWLHRLYTRPPKGKRFRGNRPNGSLKSGCKGGYRRLGQQLGGNVWRVQTGGWAVGGGRKRLAGLSATLKTGGHVPPLQAQHPSSPIAHNRRGAQKAHTAGAHRRMPRAGWSAQPQPVHRPAQRRRRHPHVDAQATHGHIPETFAGRCRSGPPPPTKLTQPPRSEQRR